MRLSTKLLTADVAASPAVPAALSTIPPGKRLPASDTALEAAEPMASVAASFGPLVNWLKKPPVRAQHITFTLNHLCYMPCLQLLY